MIISEKKKKRARETRKGWNEDEHGLAKQEAKTGMRLLREEGRMRDYFDKNRKRE